MFYFKKSQPKTPLYLQDGHALKFETVDGLWGYWRVKSPVIAADLQKAIAEERGGLVEITVREYMEFAQKKMHGASRPSGPPWREELGAGAAQDTVTQPIPALRPTAPVAPPVVVEAVAESKPTPPPVRPAVGKRVVKS